MSTAAWWATAALVVMIAGGVPDVCSAQALASWAGLNLGDYVRTRNL